MEIGVICKVILRNYENFMVHIIAYQKAPFDESLKRPIQKKVKRSAIPQENIDRQW